MRGDAERQTNMLLAVTPDSFIPDDYPIRRIKPIVDAALHQLSPPFDTMYARRGRPVTTLREASPAQRSGQSLPLARALRQLHGDGAA